MHGNVL
jgi:hypothetical protein